EDFASDLLQERDFVLIKRSQLESLAESLMVQVPAILKDVEKTVPQRFALLQLAVSGQIANTFRRVRSNHYIDTSLDVGEKITELLTEAPVSLNDFFKVVQHTSSS